MKSKNKDIKVFGLSGAGEPFMTVGKSFGADKRFWRWGDDNLFPVALALMYRRSTIHRRIINDKADYISGRGFSCDQDKTVLQDLIQHANGSGESLRQVINRLALDKSLFGNAFLEIVTDTGKTFLSLFHQDASRCRLSKDKKSVYLHHDWKAFSKQDMRSVPLYPSFTETPDGCLRSMIHYKDYEPMFENYGIPAYIAGMNVTAIAYKTDKWNISRLDNSFQLSGIMLLDGTTDSEQDTEQLVRSAKDKFAGKPGQVMFVVKDTNENDNSKFIPINSANEGDWKSLHEQATSDIVVAHSWFRSLSGLEYNSGFGSDRILDEYEIALNTVILLAQEELLEPIRNIIRLVLRVDCESLKVVNVPPARSKASYVKIWEARKADGLDYDSADPREQLFIGEMGNTKENGQ